MKKLLLLDSGLSRDGFGGLVALARDEVIVWASGKPFTAWT